MKKITAFFFLNLLLLSSTSQAQEQKSISFDIEKLKAPERLLQECDGRAVIQNIAPQTVAHSPVNEKMVDMGAHPFFNGIYCAYADHRPFELSPDMIWLLICQGFSHHINNNAEELRHMFVSHEGKESLVVKMESGSLNDPQTWAGVFPQFIEEASKSTGPELFTTLTPDFSTTTPTTRIATQITALESVQSYFEFIVLRVACGIPKITLKGSPEDWKQLLNKANALRKYKLDWWIDEIEPVLKQCIAASEGSIDKPFWRNMFKYHNEKTYGQPLIIDGWIVKFFPYNNKRERNDLKSVRSADNLPDERAVVDFTLVNVYPGKIDPEAMQFVAGFTGLSQDHKTMCLRPEIGWLVTKKMDADIKRDVLEDFIKEDDKIDIKVSSFPKALIGFHYLSFLAIDFLDSVTVPGELALSDVGVLVINGKINDKETKKLRFLFPDTYLYINDSDYNLAAGAEKKNDRFQGYGYWPKIDTGMRYFRWLRVDYFNQKIEIPENIKYLKIDRLFLSGLIEPEEEQRLVALFPETEITINDHFYPGSEYDIRQEQRRKRLSDWIDGAGMK